MKIYICADIEGVAGVVSREHLSPDGCVYAEARQWMTNEVLAAMDGARAAGASQFVISDSHGNGMNLILDQMPDDVEIVRSWPRPLEMMQGVEEAGVAGVLMIGHHGGHTELNGVLAHTFTGAIYEIRVNGEPASETRLNAAAAGELGIPTLMATGDAPYVAHAHALLGDIETVTTKEVYTDYCARTIMPARSCALIRAAAERAVRRRSDITPYRVETPLTLELVFKQRKPAQVLGMWPGVERTDATTVRMRAGSMEEAMRMIVVATSYDPNGR